MSARFVYGSKLYRGSADLGSSPAYTLLRGVEAVGLPLGMRVALLEVTPHGAPQQARTFRPGLVDPGRVPFLIVFDDQEASQDALRALETARALVAWKVELPLADGSANTGPAFWTFDGFVERLEPPLAGGDDALELAGFLKVSGPIAYTAEAA